MFFFDIKILFLPFFFLISFLSSVTFGLFFAAINVKYRDFRYILPFIIQVGIYITPVGFDTSIIPDKWKLLFYLNPLVPIIDGFRWCIIGDNKFNPFNYYSLVSFVLMILFLILSFKIFQKTEKYFADLI